MIIYIDVLLFVNAIVNYAVLMTTERWMKRSCRLYRIILGAAVGALFSLMIFIDSESRLFILLLRVSSSVSITFVAFGWRSKSEFIKVLLSNLVVSTLYCGLFVLFYQLFKPPGMVIVNDVVYLQVNPIWLLALTLVIYIIILLLHKLFSERIKSTVVPLSFSLLNKNYTCIGKIDTGCHLSEPFSSSPVIIVDSSVFQIDTDQPHRIIPYTAVGSSSYLSAVKADSITINHKTIDREVYIASTDLHNTNFQAIINSEIIR